MIKDSQYSYEIIRITLLFQCGSGNWISYVGKSYRLNCTLPWHCMLSNLRRDQSVGDTRISFGHKVTPENVTILTDTKTKVLMR